MGAPYVDGAMAIHMEVLQNCRGLCVPWHRLQETRLPVCPPPIMSIFCGDRPSPATATLLGKCGAAATGYRVSP